MLSTVEKSLSKSVNGNHCWALLLGVHVGEGACPHIYSAVDDTQGRRRRKQGREKGRQTRLPLWANRTWGARPPRGRPRSEQDGPCNQNTAEGTRLRLCFISKAHRIVQSHRTTFYNQIGNGHALPGAGDRRTIRRK